MERLTRRWGPEEKQLSGQAICEFDYCPEDTTCASCVYGQKNNRLADIEDILGSEYDLDHLKQIIEADREGRCAILSEPMKPMIYKPNDTDVYFPTCGETLSGGWPLVEWEDGRTMYQCPYCGQSIDTQVCEPYESALKAMKEREEK